MKRVPMVTALVIAVVFGAPAIADDDSSLLRFEGGIGVDPVAGISAGAPLSNVVQGVSPGGRPWVIKSLRAKVMSGGRIKVKGEGLLLSATDNIGGVGGVTTVAATLFCSGGEPAGYSSSGVPLNASGDFEIKDMLTGLPPTPCDKPVLLIRNVTAGVLGSWFAAAIPKN